MSSISEHISRSGTSFQTGGELKSQRAQERARYLEQQALYRRDTENITQTIGAWVSTYRTAISLDEIYLRVISSKAEQKDSHLRRFWSDGLPGGTC